MSAPLGGIGPLGGGGPIGRGAGASADADAFYLHQLGLAAGTQFGNAQDTLESATMESNGIEFRLRNLLTATPVTTSMAAATSVVGYSWPIELAKDVGGVALTSPHNACTRPTFLACLERAVTPPNLCGVLWGICQGADPTDGTGQGIAIGLDWAATTLRRTKGGARADTWALVTGGTGTNTCFGSRSSLVGHGTASIIQSRATPLDAGFLPLTGTTNIAVYVAASSSNVDLCDHVFVCAFSVASAASDAPTTAIRVDGLIGVAPYVLE